VGDVFDDAATGQGLLNYFLRALGCGALDEEEVLARTGLPREALATRSFVAILARVHG
ncbi:MAG TPA: phosphoenolpyruvate kinase, partial [Thermoanaerobaculia bacterium]